MSFDKSIKRYLRDEEPLKKNIRNLVREDTLNLSPILNETSIFKTLNDTSLRHVLDESSILANPGFAGDGLSCAFFEIIQNSRPSAVLDTLSRLSQVCFDSLELVEPWNRYNAQNYWLAEEGNTWKLLHCLYADSMAVHPDSLGSVITEPTLSQQTLVEALFQTDSEIRLLRLLADWLEATAAYQEKATCTAAPVVSNDVHWGNTLHHLLIGSSLFNKERGKAMITCMDPDAPRRQSRAIHSDDLKEDNDLCKRIFTEVRCGKFQEAISLCISSGQAWRGAVLQGWKLLHYLPREDPNAPLQVTGNASRDLWKWSSIGIANNVSENIHYRATLGILCGHLASALPACQSSWEDLLWAHLRVQIEARVDKFLHEHYATAEANTTPADVLELLQSELQTEEWSLQQIFGAVKALMEGKRESKYQTCQRYLMLGQIRSIMQDSLDWLESGEERFIRFLAHLILILRQMGKDPQHDVGDIVLEKYVSQLIGGLDGSLDCPELIAYYTSTVPNERQIILYAELMDKIYKSEFREGVIIAGASAGIDISASARLAVKKAISDIQEGYGNIDVTFTLTTAVEKDKTLIAKVIASLEWLSLIENQLCEAVWLSNAMVRTFIFIGNTEAALGCVTSMNRMFPDFVKKLPTTSSELREHLCLKSYLEALEGFATWYRHYTSGQPKAVEALAPDASFSDKVHHEQKTTLVERQKARWRNAVQYQSRHAKSLLYNVMLFPGGWLQDENDCVASPNFNEHEKEERAKQLETLRRLCIPEVVILIMKILQSTDNVENHKEVLKLSDLIAGENRCLYKNFSRAKLLEFLERTKESSLLLLEKGRDMFGYELND